MNRPLVKLRISYLARDGVPGFSVDALNLGGAPVAITSITVYGNEMGFGSMIDDRLERKAKGVKGPRLPFAVNSYHSQKWTFDAAWVKEVMEGATESGKPIIEVGLATGQTVMEELDLTMFDISDE